MIFNSTIYVAFVISALTAFNQITFFNRINFKILFFTFLSSFLFYLTKGVSFINLTNKYLVTFFLITFYVIVIFLLNFHLELIGFYLFLFCVSFLYRFKIKWFSLRTIPFLKPFIIAFVISGFSLLANFFEEKQQISIPLISYLFGSIFFFLCAIAILSDLKDIETDRNLKLKTFANTLSLFNLKLIVLLSLIGSFIFFLRIDYLNNSVKLSYFFTLLVFSILVIMLKKTNKYFYYTLFIDGCLSLPLITYCIILSFK